MSDLRTAAQQALEALKNIDKEFSKHGRQHWPEAVKARAAIAPLRAALAEDDGMYGDRALAVAWRWGYRSVTTGEMDWRGYVEIPAHPNLRSPAIIMQPLYTAPPQRKPLTEEEISNIWDGHVVPVFGKNGINPIVFARSIETAHGIGEKE